MLESTCLQFRGLSCRRGLPPHLGTQEKPQDLGQHGTEVHTPAMVLLRALLLGYGRTPGPQAPAVEAHMRRSSGAHDLGTRLP